MSHIFISYSKQDIDFARYLRALLEGEGFAVWMDEVRLQPSARWWKSIEKNIETCSAFVIVMSLHAADSDWVEREILVAEKSRRPLYPVLLAGNAWSRLANIQYEDMRAGLHARLSASFVANLRARLPQQPQKSHAVTFTITKGNIVDFEADMIALKHARNFYGSDALVTRLLEELAGIDVQQLHVQSGSYCLIDTQGGITAPSALYIGTPSPRRFGYQQIHDFAYQVLEVLAYEAPQTQHLAMTIHGPGFGLDEAEALRSQFAGYMDALKAGAYPAALERLTILEIDGQRVTRLRALMDAAMTADPYAAPLESEWGYRLRVPDLSEAPASEEAADEPVKRHAFVAIPSNADAEDIFYYGVQAPIHALGLLCERMDQEDLTEDWLDQIKRRIDTAAVFVADLSDPDPRVYLQLGYAWGKGRPTILLAKSGSLIAIETGKHTPILYERIKDVETALAHALDALKEQRYL